MFFLFTLRITYSPYRILSPIRLHTALPVRLVAVREHLIHIVMDDDPLEMSSRLCLLESVVCPLPGLAGLLHSIIIAAVLCCDRGDVGSLQLGTERGERGGHLFYTRGREKKSVNFYPMRSNSTGGQFLRERLCYYESSTLLSNHDT